MQRIARFEKVSAEQFFKEGVEGGAADLRLYESIRLPRRATEGSAGYDFFAPGELFLPARGSIVVRTGVRAIMEAGWVLMLFPRSGLGFRFGMRLNNTVGIIDGDYCLSSNEGHILIKLCNPSDSTVTLEAGAAFAQGIFLPFGITEDDCARGARDGGFGSTG